MDLHARVGFFAQLTDCLSVLAHCDRHHLRPYIVLSSPFYRDPEQGGNWFDSFFELPVLTDLDRERIAADRVLVSRVCWPDELGIPRYTQHMDIEGANRLVNRYMRIRPEILSYVDSFVTTHFAGKSVVGIHYRGTDKQSEAPRVERDMVRRVTLAYLDDHPQTDALYVASDERSFIEWSLRAFDPIPVITHSDEYRSHGDKARHDDLQGDNTRKGWEALVNSLLLSRCAALIRTTSFLSAWASVFNPGLPVVLLNKPYPDKFWFPERDIAGRSMDRYVNRS